MNNLDWFEKENNLKKVIDYNEKNYRTYDPGRILYRFVLKYKGDKYSDEFIELIYATLIAWNMNSRRAKLNNFNAFKKSIIDNKYLMKKLSNKSLVDIKDENVVYILSKLFINLKLVDKTKKSTLVTFSKFIHFYFPELIVPIDRTYTCKYFGGSIPEDNRGQLKKFFDIENEFSKYRQKMNKTLKKYKNESWNLCINKIMDNMVIGYIQIKYK
jgi:hypothetical protein